MRHTYLNGIKESLPSVTTVISQLDKPYLVGWANALGLKGYHFETVRNNAAETGTLAHKMVENYINNKEEDFSYHPLYVPAKRSFDAFQEWLCEKDIEFLGTEVSLVDGLLGFGGTIDIVAKVDNKLCVIDIKTSNRFSVDYHYQVAAYSFLLEHGKLNDDGNERVFPLYSPDYSLLLRLDKKNSNFEEKWFSKEEMETPKEIFLSLLKLYQLRIDYK
ncbi:MAG: PD-(D/E)XK nuclease family protein [Caldisericia bacterium]|nr:PD-(D/E)XK nuclease family protein [Caldisericia bacterium]